MKEAVSKLGIKLILTKEIKKASLVIGLKKHLKQNLKLKKLALQNNIPIYSINRASVYQLTKLIQFLFYQKFVLYTYPYYADPFLDPLLQQVVM